MVIPSDGVGQLFWQSVCVEQLGGHCIAPLEVDDVLELEALELEEDDDDEEAPPLPGFSVFGVDEQALRSATNEMVADVESRFVDFIGFSRTMSHGWLVLGSCARGPSDTLRAYAQALREGRVDDAYRLLSDDAKRSMSLQGKP
ncbi:MAG TPA: hypothetical protein PKA58_36060 [Polyangium sp.]|nr:hypothetical protein [Polyangium sp.]